MAEKIKRKFWIIPGEVDKEGRQVEYSARPSTGPLGADLPWKRPVEVEEEMTDDGEYVQYVMDGGQRIEMARGVDKARLSLSQERRQAAKGPERIVAPSTDRKIVSQGPDGKLIEADNPNYARPETVTRPAVDPMNPRGGAKTSTEEVSLTQANYDLTQAKMLQDQMNQAAAKALQEAELAIKERQLTAQQALKEYNEKLDRIKLEGDAQARALQQRGQDISARGQDISANVSQRGQDMDFQTSMVRSGVDRANALLPYWNAPGQIESYNSLMAGGPPVPTQPGTPPPGGEPAAFLQLLAQQAQQQAPSRYVLPGVPPPVPVSSGYALPAR